MLQAWMHRKLRKEQENSEDVLTATVFGALEYANCLPLTHAFLSSAIDASGKSISLPAFEKIETEYWPSFKENSSRCQPDILITGTHADGSKSVIAIESKFHSGKSSFPDDSPIPNDQLAKEWDNLSSWCKRTRAGTPTLIYLTADEGFPRAEIEESQDELRQKRGNEGSLYWLSWSHLHAITTGSRDPILSDLAAVLERCNFASFQTWQERNWKPVPYVASWTPHREQHVQRRQENPEAGRDMASLIANTRMACKQLAAFARRVEGFFLETGFLWFEAQTSKNRGGQAVQIRDTLDEPELWLPPYIYRVFRDPKQQDRMVVFTILFGASDEIEAPETPILSVASFKWHRPISEKPEKGDGKTSIAEEFASRLYAEEYPVDGQLHLLRSPGGKIVGDISVRSSPMTETNLDVIREWVRDLSR